MTRRSMPELDARAVAIGLALSILVAILSIFLGFPAIGALAGVAIGGSIGRAHV